MLSDKLKESTKQNHQQLEKTLVGKLKAIHSAQEYIDLLKLFYGYFGGLEQEINNIMDTALLPDHGQRRKTQAIADDLLYLGSDIPEKAEGYELPQMNDSLQALGALYVMEGSTLGGTIISKMIQQHLHLEDKGLSFFTGYGSQTPHMWEVFKQALNEIDIPGDESVVIASANQTFLKFGEWFNRNSTH
jgi:heme oxygenase